MVICRFKIHNGVEVRTMKERKYQDWKELAREWVMQFKLVKDVSRVVV